MKRADALGGLALLVFAALYYQQSFSIVRGFASDRLGPAFFPRLLAIVLAVLAITLIVRAARGRSDAAPLPPVRGGLLAATTLLTAAYVVVLPFAGFLLATPVLLAALIWLLGIRRWPQLLGVAVGIAIVLYLAFDRGLHVLLPRGML